MKHAIEGLILLANSALMRISTELETTRIKNRVIGPISDIILALKGLKEIVASNPLPGESHVMHSYITTFIQTVIKRKKEIYYKERMGVEGLVSDWGSIFQTLEEDCLVMFGYIERTVY